MGALPGEGSPEEALPETSSPSLVPTPESAPTSDPEPAPAPAPSAGGVQYAARRAQCSEPALPRFHAESLPPRGNTRNLFYTVNQLAREVSKPSKGHIGGGQTCTPVLGRVRGVPDHLQARRIRASDLHRRQLESKARQRQIELVVRRDACQWTVHL